MSRGTSRAKAIHLGDTAGEGNYMNNIATMRLCGGDPKFSSALIPLQRIWVFLPV